VETKIISADLEVAEELFINPQILKIINESESIPEIVDLMLAQGWSILGRQQQFPAGIYKEFVSKINRMLSAFNARASHIYEHGESNSLELSDAQLSNLFDFLGRRLIVPHFENEEHDILFPPETMYRSLRILYYMLKDRVVDVAHFDVVTLRSLKKASLTIIQDKRTTDRDRRLAIRFMGALYYNIEVKQMPLDGRSVFNEELRQDYDHILTTFLHSLDSAHMKHHDRVYLGSDTMESFLETLSKMNMIEPLMGTTSHDFLKLITTFIKGRKDKGVDVSENGNGRYVLYEAIKSFGYMSSHLDNGSLEEAAIMIIGKLEAIINFEKASEIRTSSLVKSAGYVWTKLMQEGITRFNDRYQSIFLKVLDSRATAKVIRRAFKGFLYAKQGEFVANMILNKLQSVKNEPSQEFDDRSFVALIGIEELSRPQFRTSIKKSFVDKIMDDYSHNPNITKAMWDMLLDLSERERQSVGINETDIVRYLANSVYSMSKASENVSDDHDGLTLNHYYNALEKGFTALGLQLSPELYEKLISDFPRQLSMASTNVASELDRGFSLETQIDENSRLMKMSLKFALSNLPKVKGQAKKAIMVIIKNMNEWVRNKHNKSDLYDEISSMFENLGLIWENELDQFLLGSMNDEDVIPLVVIIAFKRGFLDRALASINGNPGDVRGEIDRLKQTILDGNTLTQQVVSDGNEITHSKLDQLLKLTRRIASISAVNSKVLRMQNERLTSGLPSSEWLSNVSSALSLIEGRVNMHMADLGSANMDVPDISQFLSEELGVKLNIPGIQVDLFKLLKYLDIKLSGKLPTVDALWGQIKNLDQKRVDEHSFAHITRGRGLSNKEIIRELSRSGLIEEKTGRVISDKNQLSRLKQLDLQIPYADDSQKQRVERLILSELKLLID
jgi:hypothetical protein